MSLDQTQSPEPPAMQACDLSRAYHIGHRELEVLRDVSFKIYAGEFIAIAGPSGSGKSTLLHLLGCLDLPTSGRLLIDGHDTRRLSTFELAALRRERIGFVFQMFNLLPKLTALENTALPLAYCGWTRARRRRRAYEVLEKLGLADRWDHRPDQLSGGERQRVAIARALVASPSILLADEPTGNLDTRTTREILALLRQLREQLNVTLVLVTHDSVVAENADRLMRIEDGLIVEDRQLADSTPIL